MEFYIDETGVGGSNPVYFIAEIGSNFDQDIERAKDLIELALESGANAVKFQHYTAETLVSDRGFRRLDSQLSHQANWKKSVFETYNDASFNDQWTRELCLFCKSKGVTFFTSPYSYHLADRVEPYVPAYKIGSGDISHIDFIDYIAQKNKPVLLATGASTSEEVDMAVQTVLLHNPNLVLMQCNTNYQGALHDHRYLNLNTLITFRERYPNVVLGLSDHTKGYLSVVASVALGAKVIEKHFTDNTNRDGPDHPFSMNPESWKAMIEQTRILEDSLGDGVKRVEDNEKETYIVQRRSICTNKLLKRGHILTVDDFDYLRPLLKNSFNPYEKDMLIGKKLMTSLDKGEVILNNHFG
jgi:sialic acid synthase SpsE